MHYPQLLVYEGDRLIAGTLRPLADERKWVLREPRQAGTCLRLLRRARPAVLVVKIGTDVVRELALVERVHWLRPEAFTVVVGEVDNPQLAGLAWHLGASYALLPPQPRGLLVPVVISLMERAVEQHRTLARQAASGPAANDMPVLPEGDLEEQ